MGLLGLVARGSRVVPLEPVDDAPAELQSRLGDQPRPRRAGEHDARHLRVGSRPRRPLMREIERFVVVNGDDQVVIVVRESQLGKLGDAVPFAGPENDRPFLVDRADPPDRLGEDGVDDLGRGGVLGLVEELECQPFGGLGVMGRELTPDRQELRGLAFGVAREIVEVVDVDHDAQPLPQAGLHERIGTGVDLGTDPVLGTGSGVMMPSDRDPGVVEALVADVPQIFGSIVYAPVLAGRRFESIAQVGTAKEPTRRPDAPGSHGRRAASSRGGRRAGRRGHPDGSSPGDRRRPSSMRRASGYARSGHSASPRRRRRRGSVATAVPPPDVQDEPGEPIAAFEPAVLQRRAFNADVVPEDLLAIKHAPGGFLPWPHQAHRDDAVACRPESERGLVPAPIGDGEVRGITPRLLRLGHPVHSSHRPATLDHPAILECLGLSIGHQVEPGRRRELDRLAPDGQYSPATNPRITVAIRIIRKFIIMSLSLSRTSSRLSRSWLKSEEDSSSCPVARLVDAAFPLTRKEEPP